MFLERIVAHKQAEVARQRRLVPRRLLEARISEREAPRPFARALQHEEVAVIAEVKRASPSRGVLREDFDPAALARAYARGGARAVSVLTDEAFFGGGLPDLAVVHDAVSLPLLRKDFIIDPYQLYEAAAWRADAALLIVAALDQQALRELLALTEELSLAAVVEVHDGGELERAMDAGAVIIGINNRNLHTFATSLEVTEELTGRIPADRTVISESGINGREDVARVARAGADAILVGESLMRSDDPAALLGELTGVDRCGRRDASVGSARRAQGSGSP